MKCKRCGDCCGRFLPMTATEVQKIRKYVKEHNVKGKKNDMLTCKFYDSEEKKCLIYEVRPAICRAYYCNWKFGNMSAVNLKAVPMDINTVCWGENDEIK
jgi:Fe-S-cluster containining protein